MIGKKIGIEKEKSEEKQISYQGGRDEEKVIRKEIRIEKERLEEKGIS